MGKTWLGGSTKLNISLGNRISPKGDVLFHFLSAHIGGQLSSAISGPAYIETFSSGHLKRTQAPICPS